jgi:hypothetical protein
MRKTSTAGAAVVAACGASLLGTLAAGASLPAAAPARLTATVPHTYRYGEVPLLGPTRSALPADSSSNLVYGGGIDGVGVTTGHEQVYLVFWGSQWGTAGSNSKGYVTYSGDPAAMAPDLQAFFDGLGTDAETWSDVMTQYCEGVATGSQDCGASDPHVAYPSGGALAGVWEDTSAAEPSDATQYQLGEEAEAAAKHFANTTQASNRDAQYVIVSPTGTHPDGFDTSGGDFCAWHDYTGDSLSGGGSISGPQIAFTNLPYIPDAGADCGEGFVNSPGALDGVTIVEGHEYAETITDQFPAGGWLDSSGNEAADKCIWIPPGTSGGATDITLATGSFPVQAIWANDDNGGTGGCETSHPTSGAPGAPGVPVVTAGSTSVAGKGQVGLSFAAAAQNAAPVSGYTVLPSPACPACRGLALGGSTTTTTVTGLTPGIPYTFTVYGTNDDGSGFVSAASRALVTTTVPGAPRTLAVVSAPNATALLAWPAPSLASGLPVERYLVGVVPACPICKAAVNGTQATVTGLRKGVRVVFTVRAVDRDGTGAAATSRQVLVQLGSGYWLATATGRVFATGDAAVLGAIAAPSSAPVVGIVATPDGQGYLLVTSDGAVAAFGDATFHGDLPQRGVVVGDIVAVAPTVDGGGYWLIGADGGLFAFGDARYHGSLPGRGLHVTDVAGMVAAPSGAGYLLIGADGGVFAFGAARYYGSLPGLGVRVHDIVAILPSVTERGYVLVGADGGAFVFGTGARFFGSLPSKGVVVNDIVGLALTPDGAGYLMAGADGSVYGFGDAVVYPPPAGVTSAGRVAAIAGV